MGHYRAQGTAVAGVDIAGDGKDVFPRDIAQPESFAELLGWKPQVSLQEGMRRTEQWASERGLLGRDGGNGTRRNAG